jgi:hypothetical protein
VIPSSGPAYHLAMDPVTIFGIAALTFMLLMYALERRDPRFILGFAVGCALSSAYGFLSGAWPFGVVEIVWCGVALRRFGEVRRCRTTAL